MTYLDLYAGNAQKLPDRLDHLQSLGITHLHLLPPYAVPEGANDGGYAVSDYRRLRPDLGTTKQLRRSVDKLRIEGVGVVLDLVCNHTAADHTWARAALDGDPQFADFYYFFPDRTLPDQLSPHLRPIFPDRGGDAFTWLPEKKLWVWTTFHSYQWDLNYRNPRVLAAVAGEMLYLANLGVAAIRMDATPFLWKEPGTSCENRPEAHFVLQILRLIADLACPSVVFLSEAIVHPDDVASYVNPAECELGYNPLLMTSVWDALATEDVRFLVTALRERFALPSGCHSLTYLRSHDDIGWGFADEDALQMGVDPRLHRRYLNGFYSGAFPGSFARGELFQHHQQTGDARISGALASLAGLESALSDIDPAATDLAVDRIIAAFAVIIFAGGIPLLMIGDEVGSLSDHSYRADPLLAADNRWSHRHRFSAEAFDQATLGIGPEGRVLAALQALLELRRSLPPLGQPRTVPTGHRGTLGFDNGPITVLVNLSQSVATRTRTGGPRPPSKRGLAKQRPRPLRIPYFGEPRVRVAVQQRLQPRESLKELQLAVAGVAVEAVPHQPVHEDPRPAMDRARTEGLQSRLVHRAGITLVGGKVPKREMLGLGSHNAIAGDLGQDRGRRNRQAGAIAANDTPGATDEVPIPVDDDAIGRAL